MVEYLGEVVPKDVMMKRLRKGIQNGATNFYILHLEGEFYIDAEKMGNKARFANHSCDPNCVVEKWTVASQTRVGIYAKEDIPKGTEITFDYNFEAFCEPGCEVPCKCGSANCSGFLGRRPTKAGKAVAKGKSKSSGKGSLGDRDGKKRRKTGQ